MIMTDDSYSASIMWQFVAVFCTVLTSYRHLFVYVR